MLPQTLDELLYAVTRTPVLWPVRSDGLLWPGQSGLVAMAVTDEDDCEVNNDNFMFVQSGAVLYVTAHAPGSITPTPAFQPWSVAG